MPKDELNINITADTSGAEKGMGEVVAVTKAWFFASLDHMYYQWQELHCYGDSDTKEKRERFAKVDMWAGMTYSRTMNTWVEEWVNKVN